MGCCDGWKYTEEEKKLGDLGVCPDCGGETVDGQALEGCAWSPVLCETCGDAPCDLSC